MTSKTESGNQEEVRPAVIVRRAADKIKVTPVEVEAPVESAVQEDESETEEVATTKPPVDLRVMLGRQNNAYWTEPHLPTDAELTKEITWVLRRTGVWCVRKNDIGTFLVQVADAKIPGFPEENLAEGFTLKHGKIPYELFPVIMALFYHYQNAGNNEVYAQILYSRSGAIPEGAVSSGRWFIEVPPQKVSGASVKFEHREEILRDNDLVFEIHSHNQMQAYFSGTDNADEKSDRLFAVVGKLNMPKPEMKFSFVCAGKRVEVAQESIFTEAPLGATFPKEWLDRIQILNGYNSSGYGTGTVYTGGTNYSQGLQQTSQTSGPLTNYGGRYHERYGSGSETSRQMASTEVSGFTRGSSYDETRGSSAVQRTGTSESTDSDSDIRKKVEEATEVALEPLLRARNFMRDEIPPADRVPKVVQLPDQSKPKTVITEVRSGSEVPAEAPFFRQNTTGAAGARGKTGAGRLDQEMVVWRRDQELKDSDQVLENAVNKIRMQLQNQDIGGPMTRDEKSGLFRDLLAHLEEDDVAVLVDAAIDCGYVGTVRDSLTLAELAPEGETIETEESNVGDGHAVD